MKYGFVLFLTLNLVSSLAAANRCHNIFYKIDLDQTFELTPVEQWLAWEQRGNDPGHKQPDIAELPVRHIPKDQVNVSTIGKVPAHITESLIGTNSVNWLVDPTNTLKGMPFEDRPIADIWKANYTMSRSKIVFTSSNKQGYSVKLATNNPQKGENNPAKADLRKSVVISIDRGRHVEAVENKIGVDPRLVVIKDVMSFIDKESGNGFVVRDISYLLNGSRFLPNMSIPFLGRQIAKLNGHTYESFFAKNYVEDLAVAKALLLIRYGLQMKYPHGQNTLKEFSIYYKPKVATVVRDMSDTSLVDFVAKVIAPEAYKIDTEKKTSVMDSIEVNWRNSSYQFEHYETDPNMIATRNAWGVLHVKTYIKTIEKELQVQIPKRSDETDIVDVQRFLKSDEGQQSLLAYHDRLAQQHAHVEAAKEAQARRGGRRYARPD